jgi:hypothetical protein
VPGHTREQGNPRGLRDCQIWASAKCLQESSEVAERIGVQLGNENVEDLNISTIAAKRQIAAPDKQHIALLAGQVGALRVEDAIRRVDWYQPIVPAYLGRTPLDQRSSVSLGICQNPHVSTSGLLQRAKDDRFKKRNAESVRGEESRVPPPGCQDLFQSNQF